MNTPGLGGNAASDSKTPSIGAISRRAPVRAFLGSLAVIGALAASAASASAAVVINEVESDDPAVADFVELMNVDAAPAAIGGYVIKDSDNGHAFTIPPATVIPANGYYVADVASGPGGFGLGSGDSARLFAPADLVNPIDSYTWASHAAATYGRCPDGSGPMSSTASPTRGAANSCPVPALAWPGSSTVAPADGAGLFGTNVSGLAFQSSGSGASGVLWAVRNSPSTLFRLIYDGTQWTPDTANGWANGKQLLYPNGAGAPDAEGVTLAGGDPNGIYVATERDGGGPSRPAVLRYDVSSAGSTLTATKDWNLTLDLPGLGGNAGLEAVTWVPDDLLVAKGFFDEAAAATYNPASYPDHGAGLFFVGVEQDGKIIAYALNQTTGAFTRVATIASGFPAVMELTYEPESTHLWAICDDGCNGRSATLDIAQAGPNAGRFTVTNTFERPTGMPNLNNEGFAIASQAECVNGLKPVFWSDDSNPGPHALRTGALKCTPLVKDPTPTPTPAPMPTESTSAPVLEPFNTCCGRADRMAPQLAVALKISKSGTFAVRRTGKFRAAITLGERADLTITATARKSTRSRARTILKTTRSGVAAGKATFTLSLKRSVRASLRRGETVTLTVQARDAAGNVATRRVTAKLP